MAAGFGAAGALQVAALLAAQSGFAGLGRAVDWPTMLLTALAPGSAALFGGFALAGVVYSALAYLIFRKTLAGD